MLTSCQFLLFATVADLLILCFVCGLYFACLSVLLAIRYVSLLKHICRKKGILFVAIDQKRPLSDQGPFDIVLHKV